MAVHVLNSFSHDSKAVVATTFRGSEVEARSIILQRRPIGVPFSGQAQLEFRRARVPNGVDYAFSQSKIELSLDF